jgi:RNA-binding motif X-linked protein 2
MNTTKSIKNLADKEIRNEVATGASWHQDYKDSSYIFIANLHYEMTEGDIAIVFS